jgi:hypothetical protein
MWSVEQQFMTMDIFRWIVLASVRWCDERFLGVKRGAYWVGAGLATRGWACWEGGGGSGLGQCLQRRGAFGTLTLDI